MTTIITIELRSLRTENWQSSWKTNNEKNKLVVDLWKSSQHLWGDNQPLQEPRIDESKDIKTSCTKRVHWELGLMTSTMIATIHRKSFRWSPNQDSSMKKSWVEISHDHRIGGFNYLILERKTLRGSYTNKNAIIPPQMIRRKNCTWKCKRKNTWGAPTGILKNTWEWITSLMDH